MHILSLFRIKLKNLKSLAIGRKYRLVVIPAYLRLELILESRISWILRNNVKSRVRKLATSARFRGPFITKQNRAPTEPKKISELRQFMICVTIFRAKHKVTLKVIFMECF